MTGWLASHDYRRGAVVDPQALYALGAEWYATRLDPDWQPAPAGEAEAIFRKHGLTGDFWRLSG